MRRELIFAILVLLAILPFINAQNSSGIGLNDSIINLNESKSKTNQFLEEDIEIPENLQFLTKGLFGIRHDGEIDFTTFIIFAGLFVVVLIVMKSVMALTPFGENNLIAWGLGLVVTLLIGVSGGLLAAADFILSIAGLFGVLKGWSVFKLIVALLLLGLFFYGSSKLLNILKENMKDAAALRTNENLQAINVEGEMARRRMRT